MVYPIFTHMTLVKPCQTYPDTYSAWGAEIQREQKSPTIVIWIIYMDCNENRNKINMSMHATWPPICNKKQSSEFTTKCHNVINPEINRIFIIPNFHDQQIGYTLFAIWDDVYLTAGRRLSRLEQLQLPTPQWEGRHFGLGDLGGAWARSNGPELTAFRDHVEMVGSYWRCIFWCHLHRSPKW